MQLLRRPGLGERNKCHAEGLVRLAERQHGVVSSAQLQSIGLTRAAINRWTAAGRLHRIHPRVYALGHTALSLDARLTAALLYGGDEAVFSHTTAAWLWSLIETEPKRIHLTVPGRRSSLPDVRMHHSRRIELPSPHRAGRTIRPELPVTSVERALIDLAAMVSMRQLRRALAEADYRGLLDPRDLRAVLGKGRPGSRALSEAIARHLPQLAETFSELEERFLKLCESAGLPLPAVNATVGRMRVDALWREQGLAVELDGGAAHSGLAAMKRDREQMALRSMGFRVVRYSWDQIVKRPDAVIADLRRLLAA
jgi:hypothetical protein